MSSGTVPISRVMLKSVALPSEHGGWGFLLEPILLGLLVAGSWPGFLLGLSALGVFLVHQPLKLALKDYRRAGRRPPRAIWALRFSVGYGLVALLPFAWLLMTQPWDFLQPVLLAVPLALVQLAYDARNQSRHLAPELCGALALAMIASVIAVLGGWDFVPALVLWVIIGARAVASILYVRTRITLERGKAASPIGAWVAHGVALMLAVWLWLTGQTYALTVSAFVILAGRAFIGLSRYRKARPVKVIGMQELAYGLLTVVLVAAGYALGS